MSSITNNFWWDYLIWIVFVNFFVFLAMLFTHIITPGEYGAGVPAVKSVLHRAAPTSNLKMSIVIGRLLTVPFSVGAGICLGRLGPTCHVVAILAYQILKFPLFKKLNSDMATKIPLISCGSAIGFASSFGTPAGGVFFAVDTIGTYYNFKSYWKLFFAAIVATLTTKFVSGLITLRCEQNERENFFIKKKIFDA